MSIEGQVDDFGRLTPICCAANIPDEIKDRFITANQDYQNMMTCYMVFVDDLAQTYTEESEIGEETGPTSAPFRDKSPQECHALLRQNRAEAQSDIACPLFIVMDERSLQDETVLLVQAPSDGEEGEVKTVRAEFQVAYSQLMVWEMAYEGQDVEADQATAGEAEDGVLRGEAIKARMRR